MLASRILWKTISSTIIRQTSTWLASFGMSAVFSTAPAMMLPKLIVPTNEAKTPQPCVRILTLDGGGVRGYSSLLILREILRQFDEKLHGPDHENNRLPPQISELFDIVVGTSTGGLIALML